MLSISQFRELLGVEAKGQSDESLAAELDIIRRIYEMIRKTHAAGKGAVSPTTSFPLFPKPPSRRSFLDEMVARQERRIRRSEAANRRLEQDR